MSYEPEGDDCDYCMEEGCPVCDRECSSCGVSQVWFYSLRQCKVPYIGCSHCDTPSYRWCHTCDRPEVGLDGLGDECVCNKRVDNNRQTNG